MTEQDITAQLAALRRAVLLLAEAVSILVVEDSGTPFHDKLDALRRELAVLDG